MERKARDSDSDSELNDDGDFDNDELSLELEEDDFDDGQNDDKDAEMEGLEKKYMNLRHQEQIATFRNKLIDKWQRKTEVTTDAVDIKSEPRAFNQNISEHVSSYIKDPSRMVGQMQMWKLAVAVFGTVPVGENTAKGKVSRACSDTFVLHISAAYSPRANQHECAAAHPLPSSDFR